MTEVNVQRERFAGLSDDERELTRFALQQTAKRIMDKAADDDYAPEDLAGAAATFHLASTLAGEIGVTLGEEAPDEDSLDMVASLIASGETPAVAGFDVRTVEAPSPFTEEEDEIARDNCDIPCSDECKDTGCQA